MNITNSNEHQLSCEIGIQIADYLYGEIENADKKNFESHLSACEVCRDELAEFAVLRSSILEWRTRDFEPLETPLILLPAVRKVSVESRSWLAAFQALFAFSPARAIGFAVAASLIISIGVFWYLTNQSIQPDIAKIGNIKSTQKIDNQLDQTEVSQPIADATPQVSEKFVNTPKTNSAVKNTVTPTKVTAPVTNKSQPNQNPLVKSPSKNNAPALVNDDDEDDNSLRLSDMFDEIGMNNPGDKDSEEDVNNE